MPRPLRDLKGLDPSRILAMPYGSVMLGEPGADILRVKGPGAGDETRRWGPPWQGDSSACCLSFNRNKKSITVDLKKKKGQETVRRPAVRHPAGKSPPRRGNRPGDFQE